MVGTGGVFKSIAPFVALLMSVPSSGWARPKKQAGRLGGGITMTASEAIKRPALIKALVVDDRLSVLRREPSLQSEALRRLRLGHVVFVIRTDNAKATSSYLRIAVSRRTRGWIQKSALAMAGRAGEDLRIMRLIETSPDGLDRITLCRLLAEHFTRSPLVARALLLMGEEAERAAQSLSQRARRRIPESARDRSDASLRDYYLNDPGLDRYSRLHIIFDFNDSTSEYVYDGQAYREIIRRFPNRAEAVAARNHLDANR